MRFGHEALSQQPASGAPSRAGALHVAVTAPEAELLTPGCVLEGTEAIARVVAGQGAKGSPSNWRRIKLHGRWLGSFDAKSYCAQNSVRTTRHSRDRVALI